MKLLKCGMACCVFLSVVAWQTKDTSLQPTDAKGFIVEIQKKYVEVQAIKKKGNQEEIENKIKAVHRREKIPYVSAQRCFRDFPERTGR